MFRIIKAVSGALILIFLFSGLANAQNDHSWYVGNAGSNTRNGWTPLTAQRTLHGGILDSLSPGDTLYIMGGTWSEVESSSCTYVWNCAFNIYNIHGTPANPIVIRNYPDSAMPVFDGNGAAGAPNCNQNSTEGYHGITVCSSSYIILDSLRATDFCQYGFLVRNSDQITIQHCQADTNFSNDGGLVGGGILLGANTGLAADTCHILHNKLINNNGGHDNNPGIMLIATRHSTIRGNECTGTPSAAGIRMKVWDCDSNIIDSNLIHDNGRGIEYGGWNDGNEICFNLIWNTYFPIYSYQYEYTGSSYNSIYNNTYFAGTCSSSTRGLSLGVSFSSLSNSANKHERWFNNIIYYISPRNARNTSLVLEDTAANGDTNTFDILNYNCYYGTSNSDQDMIGFKNALYTLSEWQATGPYGYDQKSIWKDPQFLSTTPGDPNFLRVAPNTPAADSGRGTFEGGPYKTYMGAIDPYSNSDPHMSVNPGSLSFAAEPNGTIPQPKTFNLQNTGGDVLNWNISDNAQWLSVSPASGSNNSQVVTVNIETTNLSIGDYTGAITITSSNADNSPQTVMVYYSVSNDIDPPDPVEDYGCNQALKIPPLVSSTSPGYNAAVITDGVIDPYNDAATTWKSFSSSTAAPWIEIDFGEPKLVKHVLIHWAWNNNASSWTTSQAYYIQSWSQTTGYVDLRGVMDPAVGEETRTEFSTPVNTSRIRIIQLPNSGNQYSPDVMWLSELEICVIN